MNTVLLLLRFSVILLFYVRSKLLVISYIIHIRGPIIIGTVYRILTTTTIIFSMHIILKKKKEKKKRKNEKTHLRIYFGGPIWELNDLHRTRAFINPKHHLTKFSPKNILITSILISIQAHAENGKVPLRTPR